MSEVRIYLLEYEKNKPEAQRVAAETALKLENKEVKLIDVITSLEPYINDKDDGSVRTRSITYLADVLEKLPPKILSGQERHLLVDFVLARVEADVEGTAASSLVLLALESLGKWDRETAQTVMRTYLTSAYPIRQFKLQTERFIIVQLFDLLMAKYRDGMKQLTEDNADLMSKLTTYFEGEKDPRNLMIIFSILHVPMAEWDIRQFAQDLFEAVFNYFPITFKPPPDDPYGITAQDLKDRLRACIASTPVFAAYSFPALLDKLDSSALNTKRDVLHALQACVASYDPSTVSLFAGSLWDALKFEVINVQEDELAQESLRVLDGIATVSTSDDNALNSYLRPIIKECCEHLEDAPTKQSHGAGRILQSIASTSPLVADKISKGILPTLFALYRASDSITKRRGLLEILNHILRAYVRISDAQTASIDLEALRTSISDIFDEMVRALQNAPQNEVSFRLTALEGLALLVATPNLLSKLDLQRVIDTITNLVLHERIDGHGDISSQTIGTLIDIAKHVPEDVRDRAIPSFMVALPDIPDAETDWSLILKAFAQLSGERQIFDTVVLRLKNKYAAAQHQHAPQRYQHGLLLALLYAFTRGSPAEEDGTFKKTYYTDYVAPLVASISSDYGSTIEKPSLEVIGRLANIVLRNQSLHFHSSVYYENLQWMWSAIGVEATTQAERLAPFSLYYYAALRPQVVDANDIVSLLDKHVQYALQSRQGGLEQSLQHITLLVNKFVDPAAMKSTLESTGLEVDSLLQRSLDAKTVSVAFAVVKALLVQGKSRLLTESYLDLLLALLPTAEMEMPRKFSALLAPDDILTKENHCTVSGLYKQKTFSKLVPALSTAIRTNISSDAKANYLIALSGILRWLPYPVLKPSMPTLVAPLLQSLDLPGTEDQDVKASTLTIFEAILLQEPDVVAEHASSLVTRLLGCTAGMSSVSTQTNDPALAAGRTDSVAAEAATKNNGPAVRAKALQCLALVPRHLRRATILPYRRRVVKQLLVSLDDPRRAVRSEAVKCRRAWLKLEEEEEEEE